METRVIYDGTIPSESVVRSNSFTNGQFLVFDDPNLQQGEGVNIGMTLVTELNLLGGFKEKIIPTTLLQFDLSLSLDSNLIFWIPREISESNFECYCYFNSSVATYLRVYILTSNVTQESVNDSIDELKQSVEELKEIVTELQEKLETSEEDLETVLAILRLVAGSI